MSWIKTKDRLPNDDELRESEYYNFICRVITPTEGGMSSERTMVIEFDLLNRCWFCDDVIVTHWMKCPRPPMEDVE